jgi:hypothetical protein
LSDLSVTKVKIMAKTVQSYDRYLKKSRFLDDKSDSKLNLQIEKLQFKVL